jgi:hypothetical protein
MRQESLKTFPSCGCPCVLFIQLLDELRERLMQTYSSEIREWMQAQQASPLTERCDDPPF